MALTKTTEIGSIEVLQMGQIQVRTDTIIKEDGVELSKSYHRHVCEPGHDCTNENQRVQDLAALLHTTEVNRAWRVFLALSAP